MFSRLVAIGLGLLLVRCAPNGNGCSSSPIPTGECFPGYTCEVVWPRCSGSGCDGTCSVPCTSDADCAADCQCGLRPGDRDAGFSNAGTVWMGKPCVRLTTLGGTPQLSYDRCLKP